MPVKEILVCLSAYSLGCLAPGYYLVRWRCGIDIRNVGSRTTGAFNVGRVLKMPGFILTLAGDVLKGVLAMALARTFEFEKLPLMFVMAAVVLGHNFPIQLGFHGGNGLATGTGALLVFDTPLVVALVILLCISLPVLAILKAVFKLPIRYYTPSKITVAAMPLLAAALGREWWFVLGLAVLVGIILWTIRSNMRHLAELDQSQPIV